MALQETGSLPTGLRRGVVRLGLADQVYELLKSKILDVEFAPEERLTIDSLARQIGVSATPVRDALARLAAERLLAFEAYKGFTVLPVPTVDEVRESYEAREAIESFAVRVGAARVTFAQIDQMLRINDDLASHTYEGSFESYGIGMQLNARFHEIVVSTSANRFLVEMNCSLYHDLLVARTLNERGIPDRAEITAEHQAIIDAFQRKEPQGVEAAVVFHIRRARDRILTSMTRKNDLPGKALTSVPD